MGKRSIAPAPDRLGRWCQRPPGRSRFLLPGERETATADADRPASSVRSVQPCDRSVIPPIQVKSSALVPAAIRRGRRAGSGRAPRERNRSNLGVTAGCHGNPLDLVARVRRAAAGGVFFSRRSSVETPQELRNWGFRSVMYDVLFNHRCQDPRENRTAADRARSITVPERVRQLVPPSELARSGASRIT